MREELNVYGDIQERMKPEIQFENELYCNLNKNGIIECSPKCTSKTNLNEEDGRLWKLCISLLSNITQIITV